MKLKSLIKEIPLPIRLFLGKALLFFIAWKIIYNVFLYDSKYLDKPLSTHVADCSVLVLNNLSMGGFVAKREMDSYIFEGGKTTHEISVIYHNNQRVLSIANVCNGLELMVLYIGFIICMPSAFKRKVIYIVLGVIILDFVNILRCIGLIYLREYYHNYFQFAHHYLFKAIVYTTTLLIWVLYTRKIHLKNESIPV